MNIFRIAGDSLHVCAIILLLLKICKTKSCSGISGRTQILYTVVFVTRYLDLLHFISFYNTFLKVAFISTSLAVVYLIYFRYKDTHDREEDVFRIEYLIIPSFVLALVVNHSFTVTEVLWAFSIYLEAVAVVPQLVMVSRTKQVQHVIILYLFLLGSYRSMYILNWLYRYNYENHYDLLAISAGCVQTIIYWVFFSLYMISNEYQGVDVVV